MKYSTKAFCDYNLPIAYQNVIEEYYNDAQQILCDNMLMFMLTSSCSLDACIEGWSDIDILIVVQQLNFLQLKAMHEKASKYNIKIALAMLSRNEVMNRMFDDKTNMVFYQITVGLTKPNYLKDGLSLVLPQVTLEQIQQDDKTMMPWYLHKLRRLLFAPSDDKRSIIKMLYIVIKMKLRMDNIVATSYLEAYCKFAQKYHIEPVNIMSEMLSKQKLSNSFLKFARQTVEKICNGEI